MIIVLILSSTRPLRHRYVWVRCRGHCRLHLVKRRPVPRHRITCWADHLSCSLRARPCRWAAVRPVRTAATAQHRRWQLQLSMTLQRWRHRPRRPPSKCRLWWQQHLRRRKLALLPWCWPWRGTGAVPGPRSRRNADLEEVDPEVALPPAYPDSGANQQLWTKVMNFFSGAAGQQVAVKMATFCSGRPLLASIRSHQVSEDDAHALLRPPLGFTFGLKSSDLPGRPGIDSPDFHRRPNFLLVSALNEEASRARRPEKAQDVHSKMK